MIKLLRDSITQSINYLITLLILFSFAESKKIIGDVTNDGIEDKITMGLKTVTVEDGASGKLYTIISEIEFLVDITIDDYFSGITGNEFAMIALPNDEYVTEIYGYRNKRFIKVSEKLPGDISFDEEGVLYGYTTHRWNDDEVIVYWPIIEHEGLLKPAPIIKEIDTKLVVEGNSTKEIEIELPKNTLALCIATTRDENVIVFLQEADGTIIKQKSIDYSKGFFGRIYTEKEKTFTINIDNSHSPDKKTIYWFIIEYAYP